MAVQDRLTITAVEFERLAQLPENREKRLEFIAGKIIEVDTNSHCSEIAATILAEIRVYAKTHNLGLPEPMVAILPPDLAVEVVSPSDKLDNVTDKIVNYIASGTIVWVIYLEAQGAKIYAPDSLSTLSRTKAN